MANNDASILVDESSSCDIMYENLFTKLGMNKYILAPNYGTNVQGFNNTMALLRYFWSYLLI